MHFKTNIKLFKNSNEMFTCDYASERQAGVSVDIKLNWYIKSLHIVKQALSNLYYLHILLNITYKLGYLVRVVENKQVIL